MSAILRMMIRRASKENLPFSIFVLKQKPNVLGNLSGFFVSSEEKLVIEGKPLRFVLLNTHPSYLEEITSTIDVVLLYMLPKKFCTMEEIIKIAREKLGIVTHDITPVYYWHNYKVQRREVYPLLLKKYGDWIVKKYDEEEFGEQEFFLLEKDGKQIELTLNFKEGYIVKELDHQTL